MSHPFFTPNFTFDCSFHQHWYCIKNHHVTSTSRITVSIRIMNIRSIFGGFLWLLVPVYSTAFGSSATRFAVAVGRSGLVISPHHNHHHDPSLQQSCQSKARVHRRQSRLRPLAFSVKDEPETTTQSRSSSSSLSLPTNRPVLAMIDTIALLGFAAVGKASHSADGSLDLAAVAATAFPFVASWFLTSPLTGVYDIAVPSVTNEDTNLVKDTFLQTVKGWALAVPLGCVLRGIIKGYIPPISFVIVTLIATLVILTTARIAFAVAEDFFVELVN